MWIEKHGAKWRIRDQIGGRKVTVESGFRTKSIAVKRRDRLEIEKIDLGPVKAGGGQENFETWAEAWWKSHARTLGSAETARTEGLRFAKHVVGRLGHLELREIDAGVIRAWLGQLAEPDDADYDPLGPKSIKNVHGYLYMALETAVTERLIRSNPCGASKLPKWEPRRPRFLSEAELAELLALVPARHRALAVFIAGTGCRVGEALGLRQRRVDVLGGRVRFESQVRLVDGRHVDVPLKTKASRRTVGLPRQVVQVLAELVSVDENGFVFASPDGGPINYQTFRQAWKRALAYTKFAGVHIHDLRHTHASILIAKGRPLTSIQRRLGHSSIKVTSDVYGGLLPEVEDDTTAAVEQAMAAVDLGGIVGGSMCGDLQYPATGSDAETNEPQVRD